MLSTGTPSRVPTSVDGGGGSVTSSARSRWRCGGSPASPASSALARSASSTPSATSTTVGSSTRTFTPNPTVRRPVRSTAGGVISQPGSASASPNRSSCSTVRNHTAWLTSSASASASASRYRRQTLHTRPAYRSTSCSHAVASPAAAAAAARPPTAARSPRRTRQLPTRGRFQCPLPALHHRYMQVVASPRCRPLPQEFSGGERVDPFLAIGHDVGQLSSDDRGGERGAGPRRPAGEGPNFRAVRALLGKDWECADQLAALGG